MEEGNIGYFSNVAEIFINRQGEGGGYLLGNTLDVLCRPLPKTDFIHQVLTIHKYTPCSEQSTNNKCR
jgi:hypothetical protein